MSDIKLGAAQPTAESQDATVTVTLDPGVAAGSTVRFSLVVVDDLGNVSPASFVDVEIRDLPTAVVTGPAAISVGGTVALSAKDSTPAGHIQTYRWQLVGVTPAPTPTPTPSPTPTPPAPTPTPSPTPTPTPTPTPGPTPVPNPRPVPVPNPRPIPTPTPTPGPPRPLPQ